MVKKSVDAGDLLFEDDIADITEMKFPLVEIKIDDQVVCFFRQDWRFALFFDFNPARNLDLSFATKTLGTLYRNLRYRHLYDAIADQTVFSRLISYGWFPFVEIIGKEFQDLIDCCEAGFDIADEEVELVGKFGTDRLKAMLSRWVAKPHFAPKEPILESAVNAFLANEPIAAIKIAVTEIEGVLAQAYRAAHGRGAKLKDLLKFASVSAERKAGGSDTLLFSSAFLQYLERYTFGNFDPAGPAGSAGSRHAVGHGAADASSYTKARALQALLTLDQIAFYT